MRYALVTISICGMLCGVLCFLVSQPPLLTAQTVEKVALEEKGLVEVVRNNVIPVGTIIAFAGDTAPKGWILCDGTEVERTTFAPLFRVIGERYGAAGSATKFRLPDLQSRSPMGAGQGVGLSMRALGESLGEEKHTLTADEMPRHKHAGRTGAANPYDVRVVHKAGSGMGFNHITGFDGSGGFHDTGNENDEFNDKGSGPGQEHTHNFETDERGGGGPANTIHPVVVVNFIIKT